MSTGVCVCVCATKRHSEETLTVWPHMQDEGQQEVKDTDVWNCRRNE